MNKRQEVQDLVVKGWSTRDISNQLKITEYTVKYHLTNIYKFHGVKSRAQLIVLKKLKPQIVIEVEDKTQDECPLVKQINEGKQR